MPEGNVLICSGHIAAHHAGTAADVLAADGVALVGHGAGTFLSLAEGFLHFMHFGALEVAHLHSHLLEA